MRKNHVHDWEYVGMYRRCLTCFAFQYHSRYKIGGHENEGWIDVDDIPEAVIEFETLVERNESAEIQSENLR